MRDNFLVLRFDRFCKEWFILLREGSMAASVLALSYAYAALLALFHFGVGACLRVLCSVVIVLLMGILAVDYRHWVYLQAKKETARMDPGLSISRDLVLSPPDVQKLYDEWMNESNFLRRWEGWLLLLYQIIVQLKVIQKREAGCNLSHVYMSLPCTALRIIRVALGFCTGQRRLQSLCSLLAQVYMLSAVLASLALTQDSCFVAFGQGSTALPAMAASAGMMAAVHLIVGLTALEHLTAQACVMGFGNVAFVYLQYWQRKARPSIEPDPGGVALLTICTATAVVMSMGVIIRYRIALNFLRRFLNSPTMRHRA